MHIATYTLKKAAGGMGHFACVRVASAGVNAISPQDSVRLSDHYHRSESCTSSWENAALLGARVVKEQLQFPLQVLILALDGSTSDTSGNDVWIASAIATWRLVKGSGQDPELSFFDGQWLIRLGNGATIGPSGET